MYKAMVVRFYPSKTQAEYLSREFGTARWVWNKGLEFRKRAYEESSLDVSGSEVVRQLPIWKNDNPWLRDVSSVSLQQKLIDLDRAFKNFFRGHRTSSRVGYPRYKSKKDRDSIRYVGSAVRYKGGDIWLPKQKKPLRVIWTQEKPKNISSITVTKNKANQYFLHILSEFTPEPKPQNNNAIGLDLGIKDYVTTSNGKKHNLPDLSKEEKKIVKLQKRHAKKQKGSKNREKARVKLAKAHLDLTNKRNDYLHKLSTQLINENQVIIVEDLAVGNMVKNRKLARSISKQSWYTFTEMLRYKSEWYGREFIKIDRFYPSSKTCFECKAVVASLPLNVRQWQCDCGALLDRDINAAKNIKAAGLAVSAYGEDVRAVVGPDFDEVGSEIREAKIAL